MAGKMSTKSDQFMQSPLVVWLNTFDDYNSVENVHDLADGILLHKVMHTIDPSNCSMTKVNRSVSHDQGLRMQNLQLLVERMRSFYLTNMQQLIIGSLPNIVSICNSPESEYSLDQMEKLLVLLLGCAVKCEPLVEKMKAMEPMQQQALVTNIKQVTHSTELVCSVDWDDLNEIPKQTLQGLCRTAYSHLQRVAKERDTQYETILEISLEKDYYKQLHSATKGHENGLSPRSPSTPVRPSPSINTELLELKKRTRHLQEQLDHKSDMVIDTKEELEQTRAIVQKLQQDKRELSEDAKAARAYRDEIEMLKVQSGKVEKLEGDMIKYKQKVEDTEYLKKKIAGLKAENDLTVQTKALLEQKIEALTSRSEALDDLQEQYASTKAQMEALQQEREMDSEKIEELLARNAHLELEFKHYEERLAQLNMELETNRVSALEENSRKEASNLSFEMSEADMTSKAKVTRLEREAKEMEKSLESLRHSQAKCVELEKMNKKLHSQTHTDRREIIRMREEVEVLKVKASRVDKLQVELNTQRERVEEAGRNAVKLKEIKTKYDINMEAKARLEDEVDSLQSKVGLLDHLKDENASLKAQMESHSTEHKDDEKRIEELLEHNAQLELERQKCSEEMETLKSQLLQLRNKSGPQAPVTMLSPQRYSEAEMASRAKLQRLEKETKEMEKTMEALRHTQAKCQELEKGNKKLMEQTHADRREIVKLKEELHSSKSKTERMDKLQKEMKSQEQQLEDVDAARRKITELKQQNSLLSEARILLQEEVSGLQAKLDKYSSSQADNMALKVRVEAMEAELQEESLRMQELIQQNVQLELDREKKNQDLKALNDEVLKLSAGSAANDSLTISPVHKPMSEEDMVNRTKVLRLERDKRELERSLEVERHTNQRTSTEMEKMNRKLTATIHADKKEIARLKEELRRERAQGAGAARSKSVTEETDFQTKQVQDLESKFKDAYSQSLSTKDERIQVLEKRVEETLQDNTQLREDLAALRKQIEKLKKSGSPSSPGASGGGRAESAAAAAGKMKDKVEVLHQTNTTLQKNLVDAKHMIQQMEVSAQRQVEKVQMLEKLGSTLEEEKKTLLTQLNKQLEKNQDLLVKTLETKDVAMEDERIFNDRLGELERDKQKLQEQLASHRRETLSRDMDYWKKTNTNKSKNILKKGLKKLKGKIQQGKSYKFDYPEGGPTLGLAGSSHNMGPVGSMGSIGSTGSAGNLGYHGHDGSMSSSQSVSSSNSKQSEEQEEEEESVEGGAGLIPRAATFDGSPFIRHRKNRGGSLILPGMGPVKLRHGSTHIPYGHSGPNMDPGNIPDDLMSLEDFLAESEKTPNRRRVMELNRASLVIGTPPSTPRNSMMLTGSSTQMFDLQEFLSKTDISDTRSKRGTIHEVEENDPDHMFMQEQAAQYKASQQSISQHSKSSNSLHSAHSASSINRGASGSDTPEKGGLPVISNPAAVAANSNFNNSNNGGNGGKRIHLQEMLSSVEALQSDGSGRWDHLGVASVPPAEQTRQRTVSARGRGGDVKVTKLSPRHSQRGHATYAQKSKALSKRTFHKSSTNVREGEGRRCKSEKGSPKLYKSSIDLSGVEEKVGSNFGDSVGPLGLDLSDLMDLTRPSEDMLGVTTSVYPSRVSREDLHGQPLSNQATPTNEEAAESDSTQRSVTPHSEMEPPQPQNSNPASQHSSQDSGELLSWEDFLVSTSPTHQGPQAAPPTLSEGSGDDSIWLEYGSM